MRVIVTRPQHEARHWVEQLQGVGFDALALPLIEVAAATDTQPVLQAWLNLHHFDAVMLVSGNAVDHFFALQPAAVLAYPRFWVTGPGSYAALTQRAGVPAHCIDSPNSDMGQFDSEALWSLVFGQVQVGTKVLIVRGAGRNANGALGVGRDWLAQHITQAGGRVTEVVAYQRLCPAFDEQQLALISGSATDGSVWIFSSSEALENLKISFPVQQWQQAKAVVTHHRIGLAASNAGFGTVLESRPVLADVMACLHTLQ
jgi:uroporphyrinogen-III synthase